MIRHDLVINGIDYNLELDKALDRIKNKLEVDHVFRTMRQTGQVLYNTEKPMFNKFHAQFKINVDCINQFPTPT